MSGLLFLNSEDFHLNKGTRGPIMCNNIQGFSLILFYSTQCQHCKELIPIFKTLPGTVGGCQFGMINISQNKKCILIAKQTITPITVVPYLIMYINGKPYMRYQGPHDAKEISRFIIEVSTKLQQKPTFTIPENKDDKLQNKNQKIPDYTIGLPLYGDENEVYFEFQGAYNNKHSNIQQSYNERLKGAIPYGAGM